MTQDQKTISLPRTIAAIEQGIEQRLHRGAQLYVSHRGRVVADMAIGTARPDSLMLWMSSTKPLVAIAIAQQWERGRLDLDDPVARHVPEFAAHGKEAITIRHVLTHTGGFRSASFNWMDAPWATQIARICHLRPEPRWTPGRKAGYHTSTGAFVLGEIVRRVDGRPLEQYLREAIFDPLQMTDTWVGMPPARFAAYGDRIVPLVNTDAHAKQPRAYFAFLSTPQAAAVCRPGSGGWGPIRQLGRVYDMILRGGEGVVEAQTVANLVRPARVGMHDHTFRHVMDWTLAFMLNSWRYGPDTCWYQFGPHASARTVGHSGHQSSCAFADLEHELAVAWACDGMPGEARHRRRWVAINAAIYEDLSLAGPRAIHD